MSLNKLRPVNPEIFDVIDGKLILQNSTDAHNLFHEDVPGNITKANSNWPEHVKLHAGKKVEYDAESTAAK